MFEKIIKTKNPPPRIITRKNCLKYIKKTAWESAKNGETETLCDEPDRPKMEVVIYIERRDGDWG